jgi:hypothetical protein
MVWRVLRPSLAFTRLLVALPLASLTLARPCSAKAEDDSATEESSAASKSDEAESEEPSSKQNDDEKSDQTAGEADKAAPDTAFGHFGQFGLRAGLLAGYRMVLRYADSPFCRTPDLSKAIDKQQKFCGHVAPLAVDLGLSFAVLDFLEPFLWARLGLGAEAETNTDALVVLGAGVRIYTMSDAAFKIFIEPAVGLELEGGGGNLLWQLNDPEYKQDFFFHLGAGPQLDFSRHVGAYVSAGVSAGVLRALGSSLDLNLGIQGRYP